MEWKIVECQDGRLDSKKVNLDHVVLSLTKNNIKIKNLINTSQKLLMVKYLLIFVSSLVLHNYLEDTIFFISFNAEVAFCIVQVPYIHFL